MFVSPSTTLHDYYIMSGSHLPPCCEMLEKQKQQEESQAATAPLTQAMLIFLQV